MIKTPSQFLVLDAAVTPESDVSKVAEAALLMNISNRSCIECVNNEWWRVQSAALEACGNALLIAGVDGVIQWVNQAFCKLSGYDAIEAIGSTPGALFKSGAQDDVFYENLWQTVLSGKVWRGKLINRRKNGTTYHEELTINSVCDEQGEVTHFIVVKEDLTERKRIEGSSVLQKAILNSANFSSIATDARGVIQIFNVGAERMLGYAAVDVMNKITPADISDPQEIIARARTLSLELDTEITPGFEALVFKASRGIEDIYELTYIRKDGSRFPAVVSVTALRDDQNVIIGYLLIGTDNTARKLIEAEQMRLDQRLRDQQFYTRSLIESNIDAIITTDPAGIITDVNKQMEALTDCSRDELIGAPFKKFFTDPDQAAAVINLVLLGSKISDYELTVRARDGKETVVSYNATTFYDRDRKLQGVFAAARDVTERKRLDFVLQEKNEELERARLVADKANLAKSDFLSSMSHEIRSPLNAILGLAYLLEQANLDLAANNMVRKIRASGRMLLSLISDILDVSKIEAGQMMIEQAPFLLADVIDNLSIVLGVAVGDKNIKLIIEPPPAGVFSLIGDALRLEQVLINLSINAIKFTSEGQVVLRTELLSNTDEEIMLKFSVHDTGIGIAPELQDGVFASFTQADSSTTRRYGGTGLGLTICRQLVNLMGGDIGLNSVLGEGSEFWFTLPLIKVADADIAAVRVEALIADNSASDLRDLGSLAEKLGWHVSAVNSGEAVLTHLLGAKAGKLPDVVVLSRIMSGIDGMAVVRAIRNGVSQGECPLIIMTTAYTRGNLARIPGAELVDALLEKPVNASKLYNAMIEAKRKQAATEGISFAMHQSAGEGLLGIRVLVVDDSEINCEVAWNILQGQGAIVSVAVNGQEAVNWLVAHPHDVDLVLMDVQMPVMDGIEATRQLRCMPQFAQLPIVALTAGAFKSQQDAAQAVGMTHFISKPFDVPSTIALIQRLCRRPLSGLNAAVMLKTPKPVDSLPSVLVMNVALGLEICMDMSSYLEYLRRFVPIYEDAVTVMRDKLALGDRPAAIALAHKLAGVAANLALPDTRRLAAETERVLYAGLDPEPALADLALALASAVAVIKCFASPA